MNVWTETLSTTVYALHVLDFIEKNIFVKLADFQSDLFSFISFSFSFHVSV